MIGHKLGQTPTRCLTLAIALFTLALTGCGGGSGGGTASVGAPSSTITGVAAVGLPLTQGTVFIKDATGALLESATIDSATGVFTLTALGGTPPYFLKAQGKNPSTGADVTLYSIATSLGTANINPLTNLIVATAAMNIDPAIKDPAALFADPARFKDISSVQLTNATSIVMANLSPQVLASLLANHAANADPIRDTFTVGSGLDKVFDNYAIHLDGISGQVELTDLQNPSVTMQGVSLMKLGPASAIAGSYYSTGFNALFVVGSNGGIYGLTSQGSYQGNLVLVDPAAGTYTARLTLNPPSGASSTIDSNVVFTSDTKQLVLSGIAAGGGDLALTWEGDANSAILAADVQDFLVVDQAHTVTLNHDAANKLTYLPDGNGGGTLSSSSDLWVLAPEVFAFNGSTQTPFNLDLEIAAAMSTASTGTSPYGNLQIQQTSQNGVINWNTFNIGSGSGNFVQPSGGVALNRVTGVNSSLITGTLTANGNVSLVNNGGILFGSNLISVGALVAQ